MRLEHIRYDGEELQGSLQALAPGDISDRLVNRVVIRTHDPVKRLLARRVAPLALRVLQRPNRVRVGTVIPLAHDWLTIGDRFGDDASLSALLSRLGRGTLGRLLIPGCYLGGEDVQFWLRRGVTQLTGIDAYSLERQWSRIVPALKDAFGVDIHFEQASIDAIPFPDGAFDLMVTRAVLEHVRNMETMVCETARVLRPGGRAWHCFGPFYYCFGGDHCIAAYGEACGYDHLLLDEEIYRARINDQAFYDRHRDPNLPFWARQRQFSFATAAEYLACFGNAFDVEHVVCKVSRRALGFRRSYPQKWEQLLKAGICEYDLLVKSLAVVLRRKQP